MELDHLDKKIRRLVSKLKTHEIVLEIFDHNDIEYGDVIGKGGEGIVQHCTVQRYGIPACAAIKTLQDTSEELISVFLDEIEMLCLGWDPLIKPVVQVFGITSIPLEGNQRLGRLAIIMEAGKMNLLQLYRSEEVPQNVTLTLWAKIASAVYALHQRKIIHQDLKLENLLILSIDRSRNGLIENIDVRVIDLGMGKRLYTEKLVTDDILGTNGYHSPEVLFDHSHDFSADIFTLGIAFSILLLKSSYLRNNLKILLEDLHSVKKVHKLAGRELYEECLEPAILQGPTQPSNNIRNMLCKMLEVVKRRTITLPDIVFTCKREAKVAKELLESSKMPFASSCCCHDSGFESEARERGELVAETSEYASQCLSRRPIGRYFQSQQTIADTATMPSITPQKRKINTRARNNAPIAKRLRSAS